MLWDPVLVSILYLPAFVDLAALGMILMLIARPRAADAQIGARR